MPHNHFPTDRSPYDVRLWAGPLLAAARQAGPTPLVGSPQWCTLPDDDPRKWAAVVRAALAWVSEATPTATARRVRAELDAVDRAVANHVKAVSLDVAGATCWHTIGPSHRELERRRAAPPRHPIPPFDPVAARRWVLTGTSAPTPARDAA